MLYENLKVPEENEISSEEIDKNIAGNPISANL